MGGTLEIFYLFNVSIVFRLNEVAFKAYKSCIFLLQTRNNLYPAICFFTIIPVVVVYVRYLLTRASIHEQRSAISTACDSNV